VNKAAAQLLQQLHTSVCISVSIIDTLTPHFKTLLKWEVTEVKIFYTNLGNCTESKTASKNNNQYAAVMMLILN